MTTIAPGATDSAADAGGASPGGARLVRAVQRQGALAVLVLGVVVATFAFDNFGTTANFTSIALQASFLAVVALGMTFVIMTGGIDLSVGSVFALGGVLAAWGSQYGALVALLLPLAVCATIGLIQGLVIARGQLPPFIVTLAGLLFARGLLLLISDEGALTYKVPDGSVFSQLAQGELFGIRYLVWIVLGLFALGGLVLHRTSYGSTVLAIGSQEEAAELMGLPVVRTKVIAYVVSATLAGFGGVMIASYTSSGVTILGVGLELDAIAAVVLGGTLLTGGAGTLIGTLVGVLLLQVIRNVINQVGTLDSNWQAVVSGLILLAVVTLQRWLTVAERR